MRYATNLLLAASLLFWIGCGGKDKKPADAGKGGTEAKKADEKKAEAPKAETPKDVVKALFEHWKAKGGKENWFTDGGDKFWTKKAVEGWKVLLAEEVEKMEVTKYEIKEEKIEADKATVTTSFTRKLKDGSEKNDTMSCVLKKEDGKWKIFKCGDVGEEEDFEEMANMKKE
jgi:hypothetical protein